MSDQSDDGGGGGSASSSDPAQENVARIFRQQAPGPNIPTPGPDPTPDARAQTDPNVILEAMGRERAKQEFDAQRTDEAADAWDKAMSAQVKAEWLAERQQAHAEQQAIKQAAYAVQPTASQAQDLRRQRFVSNALTFAGGGVVIFSALCLLFGAPWKKPDPPPREPREEPPQKDASVSSKGGS